MTGDAKEILSRFPAAQAEGLRRAVEEAPAPDAEEELLILAFLNGVPPRHHASIRARLLRTDCCVSAQSTDVDGQRILDQFYLRRQGQQR